MRSKAGGPACRCALGARTTSRSSRHSGIDFGCRNVAAQGRLLREPAARPARTDGDARLPHHVSAVPLERGKTFLQLTYSYGYGLAGRMAMQAYLGTVGADKVGFSVVGSDGDGSRSSSAACAARSSATRCATTWRSMPTSIRCARRPTSSWSARIQGWFSATERFPRQLREMDRPTYVAMKRQEHERQQTHDAVVPAGTTAQTEPPSSSCPTTVSIAGRQACPTRASTIAHRPHRRTQDAAMDNRATAPPRRPLRCCARRSASPRAVLGMRAGRAAHRRAS